MQLDIAELLLLLISVGTAFYALRLKRAEGLRAEAEADKSLTESVAHLSTAAGTVGSAAGRMVQRLEDTVADLYGRVEQLALERTQMYTRMAIIEGERDAVQARVVVLEKEIAVLRAARDQEVEVLRSELTDERRRRIELDERCARLEASLASEKAAREKLQDEIDELRRQQESST